MAAAALAAVFFLVTASPLCAATLRGRVFDASGAVVPGAAIGVRSRSTRAEQSVSTDAEGRTRSRITRTRLPTGEAGSSRQVQLAAKLSF